MPTYIFQCDSDLGGCGNVFEVQSSMQDVPKLKPTCSSCKKRKPVRRDYTAENSTVINATPATLGTLANRNTNKLSNDEKAHIHYENNKYKYTPFQGKLPDGATPMSRDDTGRLIPSKKQHKRDKRKPRAR